MNGRAFLAEPAKAEPPKAEPPKAEAPGHGGEELLRLPGASQGEEIWRLIEPSLPEASVFTVKDASLASAYPLQLARKSEAGDVAAELHSLAT